MTDKEIGAFLRQGGRLQDVVPSYKDRVAYYKRIGYPRLTRPVGIELEYYSKDSRSRISERLSHKGLDTRVVPYGSGSSYDYWSITSDNSIRISSEEYDYLIRKGYIDSRSSLQSGEIISPKLTDLSDIRTLSKLLKYKDEESGVDVIQVNGSCGLHVHVSVENSNHRQREYIFKTYQHLESEISALYPDSRTNPQGRDYARNIHGISYQELLEADKYTALRINGSNQDSEGRSRTFEYRKMNATKSDWTIRCWVLLLDSIHIYGENPENYEAIDSGAFNLDDVIKSPILWNFFNSRSYFLLHKAKKQKKTRKRSILIV